MSRSVQRAAENEAAFRRANESLEAKAEELGLGERRTPYLCECEEETCTAVVRLTHDEYEDVRASPKRFVMIPGHQEERDRVVREGAGFTVIEKSGEEGERVAALDARRSRR